MRDEMPRYYALLRELSSLISAQFGTSFGTRLLPATSCGCTSVAGL